MSKPRPPWFSQLLVVLIITVPIAVFVILEAVVVNMRAGSIDEVWFVETAAGPRLVGRDQITTGTEKNATVRHRLLLVDARTGERLAREKVDQAMVLVGATEAGLWFKPRHGGGEVRLREPSSLEELPRGAATPPAEANAERPQQPLALADAVELGGVKYVTGALSVDAGQQRATAVNELPAQGDVGAAMGGVAVIDAGATAAGEAAAIDAGATSGAEPVGGASNVAGARESGRAAIDAGAATGVEPVQDASNVAGARETEAAVNDAGASGSAVVVQDASNAVGEPAAGAVGAANGQAVGSTVMKTRVLAAEFTDPAFVIASQTGEPIVPGNPASLLVSHRELDANGRSSLRVSRIGLDGETLWKAPLERQRLIRYAHVFDDYVVLVTAGPARDFAIALDLATGATKWVHHF